MEKETEKLIDDFKTAAIRHFQYTKEGSWRKANGEVKKIDQLYRNLKEAGQEGIKALLSLTGSEIPEAAAMAAVFGMRFDSGRCLAVLEAVAGKNIPVLSGSAEQAIENWKNKDWHID